VDILVLVSWSHILTMVLSYVTTNEVSGPTSQHISWGFTLVMALRWTQMMASGYIIRQQNIRLHKIFYITSTWLSTVETEQPGQRYASEESFSLLRSKLNDLTFLELTPFLHPHVYFRSMYLSVNTSDSFFIVFIFTAAHLSQ
jgi:hypothetical protein